MSTNKIIIEGVTDQGKVFRPSDWAERLTGRMASFQGQRMIYSPMLCPGLHNGHRCIIMDITLKETNPHLYQHIIEFAELNKLLIHQYN